MRNKVLLSITASLFATVLSISAANAMPFSLDIKIGEAKLANSGDLTELNWMKSLTGDNSLVQTFKLSGPGPAQPNDANSWFINVAPNNPGFFLLKLGDGNLPQGTPSHFAFQNVAELDKLVWSNAQVNFMTGGGIGTCPTNNGNGCNIGRLSHYAGFGGGTPPTQTTPEPGTLFLMGSGLAGLGLWRWKAKK